MIGSVRGPKLSNLETESFCFLLTGVGPTLSRDFLDRFLRLSPSVRVVMGGLDSTSRAGAGAVRVKLLPNTHPDYLTQILKLVVEEKVTDIVPLINSEVLFLQKQRRKLENLGVRVWVGRSADIGVLTNKFQTYLRASALSPISRLVVSLEDFEPAIRELGYPGRNLAVKPNTGPNGSGKGFRILDETADSIADTFLRSQPSRSLRASDYFQAMSEAHERGTLPEILVSEFLSGQEYSCYISADRGDIREIGVHMKFGYEEGTTNTGHALLVEDEAVEEFCYKISRLFCLDFLNNIQLREDELGRLRLLEINPRLAGTILLSELGGIPLIESSFSIARGEPWPAASRRFEPLQIKRIGVEVFSPPSKECNDFEIRRMRSDYLLTDLRSGLLLELDMYESVIFDLDNTLIDERHFLATAMREFLGLHGISEVEKREYLSRLDVVYSSHGNNLLYDRILLEYFGTENIPAFLRILRSRRTGEDIRYLPGRLELLQELKGKGKQLYLVTDGNPLQQKAKVSMAGLRTYIDHPNIVFAHKYGGKPSLECAMKVMPLANPSVVVGDSEVDLQFARVLEADFVKILE